MATAGTPASASPVSARKPISAGQFGAKAMATVATAAATSETAMTVFRPTMSDRAPAPNMATDRTPVAADSDRLAAAGDTAKLRANAGNIGWTQ